MDNVIHFPTDPIFPEMEDMERGKCPCGNPCEWYVCEDCLEEARDRDMENRIAMAIDKERR